MQKMHFIMHKCRAQSSTKCRAIASHETDVMDGRTTDKPDGRPNYKMPLLPIVKGRGIK